MVEETKVFVIDDDLDLVNSVARLLGRHGYQARAHQSASEFIEAYKPAAPACIVSDMMMGRMNGFELADRVRAKDPAAAIVFMTAWPTASDAVDAVRQHGGLDYLEKPIDEARLLTVVWEGLAWSTRKRKAYSRLQQLTRREEEVFRFLVQGLSNKAVAAHLRLSPKTVEDHRASIMSKTEANNLADLIAIAQATNT